eukprot:COSAG02_NODE_28781_length_582_cov_1.383023_1_plen_49_part_10
MQVAADTAEAEALWAEVLRLREENAQIAAERDQAVREAAAARERAREQS